MSQIHVLISLHRGYGMGDAVQMSAVLRHVAAARPGWVIDYQAEGHFHKVGRGIVANTFAHGEPAPSPHYDAEVQILLFDRQTNWHDRPNTRVSSCLHERFGLEWDRECGRYRVDVSDAARDKAIEFLSRRRPVAVHYEGHTSPTRKNLTHDQALMVCREVMRLQRVPLLIDWHDESPIPDGWQVHTTGRHNFYRKWGGNPEMNCAVISQCEAFVGIDSGPAKCAAATETPSLVVWTGHHPAHFFDPAPNVTHLVPRGYRGLEPVFDGTAVEWFEANHNVRWYEGDPVREIEAWLAETLR